MGKSAKEKFNMLTSCESLERLRLMVVSCSEGLMVLSYSDFLSLEINDLSKGKELAKMVKSVKIMWQLCWFGACWRRPKIPHRWDSFRRIGRTLPREILYWTFCGHWNSWASYPLELCTRPNIVSVKELSRCEND